MDKTRVPRTGFGRPRRTPDSVSADKAYSNRTIRAYLRNRGIRHVIPEKKDHKAARLRRGSRAGRPPGFDKERYKERNTVERCINRLKQWRGIATRYEKTATIYLAGLHVAGIFLSSAR
jgi:transposase